LAFILINFIKKLILLLNQYSIKMKRLSFILLTLIFLVNLYAQETTIILLNYSKIENRVAKSNEEIKNPKKNIKYSTWVKRGEVMQDVYRIDLEQIYDGMPTQELKLFYKEPLKQSQEERDGKNYLVYEYERMKYYFLSSLHPTIRSD